jgi:hypothetical protein
MTQTTKNISKQLDQNDNENKMCQTPFWGMASYLASPTQRHAATICTRCTGVHNAEAENEERQSWHHPINHQRYNYDGIKPDSLNI